MGAEMAAGPATSSSHPFSPSRTVFLNSSHGSPGAVFLFFENFGGNFGPFQHTYAAMPPGPIPGAHDEESLLVFNVK